MRVLFLPCMVVVFASLFLIGISAFIFRSYPIQKQLSPNLKQTQGNKIVAAHTKVSS